MNAEHFNGLAPDQAERLALLLEEMGEALQIIGKIQRHGFDSTNPFDDGAGTNREMLERELGHVLFAIDLLASDDVRWAAIVRSQSNKFANVWQYLHHNPQPGVEDPSERAAMRIPSQWPER